MGLLRSTPHHLAYRLARGWYDQVHAVSEEVRQHHIRNDRLHPDKVVTVYNGIDLEEIDSAPAVTWPAEWRIPEGAPVVVCVANIRHVKGLDVLLRTAHLVTRHSSDVRFVVIGDVQEPEYFPSLLELGASLQIQDRVVFTGLRSDVFSLLRLCAVFFLPSRSEGLSNAMLEAMACSLPCVATRVGGNPELIDHGRNGFLVPVGDPAEAAGRILRLLADPALCERMGQASREIVEAKFTLGAMMNRVVGLYDTLLAGLGCGQAVAQTAAAEQS
jgi:glycosyltransferase involved in cell wall biosynthesis